MRKTIVSLLLILAMILGTAIVSSAESAWTGTDALRLTFEQDSDYSSSKLPHQANSASGHKVGIKGETGSRYLAIQLGDTTINDCYFQMWANKLGMPDFTYQGQNCFDTQESGAITMSISLSAEDENFIPNGNLQIKYYDGSTTKKEDKLFEYGNDGVVKTYKSGTVLGTITPGQWLNLTVVLDFSAKAFTYYANGVKVISEPMKQFTGGYVSYFNLYQNKGESNVGNTLLLDNLAFAYEKLAEDQYADYYAKHFDTSFVWQEIASFTGMNLALGKDLTFNAYAKLSAVNKDAVVEFTMGGLERTVAGVHADASCEYKFSLLTVTPQMMTTPITMTLKKGGTVLDTKTVSVEEYLLELMKENTGNSKLTEFVMAILEYGAEAIKYTEMPVDTLLSSEGITSRKFNMSTGNDGSYEGGGFNSSNDGEKNGSNFSFEGDRVVYAKSCRTYNRMFYRDLFAGAKAGDTFMVSIDYYLLNSPSALTSESTIQIRTGYAPKVYNSGSVVATGDGNGTQAQNYVVAEQGVWTTVYYYVTFTEEMMADLASITYGAAVGSFAKGDPYTGGFSLIVSMNGKFGQAAGKTAKVFDDYKYVEMYFDNLSVTKIDGQNILGEAETFKDMVAPAAPAETDSVKAATRASADLYVASAKLVYDVANRIEFRIAGDLTGKTVTLNGKEVTPVDGKVQSENISVTEFDKAFTLTVTDGENQIASATYSVNSACYALKDNATDGGLVKALFNYGIAAKNYIGG